MIYVVVREHDVENHEETQVKEFKSKDKAGEFLADFFARYDGDESCEVVGVFEGEMLDYTAEKKVSVKWK